MSYNALDNLEAAKHLRDQLVLELQDLRASLSYEYATGWCSNCPRVEREPRSYSEMEFGVQYASFCCKDDEVWAEQHQSEEQHDKRISKLLEALNAYLDEGGQS